MFLTKNFTSILLLLCTLLVASVSSLPVNNDDEDTETQSSELPGIDPKWSKTPNGRQVIIPYVIAVGAGYTEKNKNLIQLAMYDIQNTTCVRFRKRIFEKNYIRIYSIKGRGCSASIGRTGGIQSVYLNKFGCMNRRAIIHELIHAIGFSHMHQRFDRDSYITIQYRNIEGIEQRWFNKLNNQYEKFNTKYDYYSCMHYKRTTFSKNGRDTLFTKDPVYQDIIGKVSTLSLGDARRINRMYNCPNMGIYA